MHLELVRELVAYCRKIVTIINATNFLRFSIPNFEHMDIYERIHDPNSPDHNHPHPLVHGRSRPSLVPPSVLEWVEVVGAGVLHNDKSPAIFSFHEAPRLRSVTVSGSAHDGLSVVSATDGFEMLYNR